MTASWAFAVKPVSNKKHKDFILNFGGIVAVALPIHIKWSTRSETCFFKPRVFARFRSGGISAIAIFSLL